MKEGDIEQIKMRAYSGKTESYPNMRRDTLEGLLKNITFVTPVSGKLLVHKGREDLGEDPNLTTGVSVSFSHTDGEYRFSIASAAGIEIPYELQLRILAQGEKSEGVQVTAGEPILRLPGNNQTVVYIRELLQK